MSDPKQARDVERAVGRIMKTVEKYDQIGKSEFEAILGKVMQQVHKNTDVGMSNSRTPSENLAVPIVVQESDISVKLLPRKSEVRPPALLAAEGAR